MQTNFENKVREQLQNFNLKPSEQVWDDISVSLNKEKKRRVAGWRIYASAFALIGAGFLLFNYFTSSNQIKSNIQSKTYKPVSLPAINIAEVKKINPDKTQLTFQTFSNQKKSSVSNNIFSFQDRKSIVETNQQFRQLLNSRNLDFNLTKNLTSNKIASSDNISQSSEIKNPAANSILFISQNQPPKITKQENIFAANTSSLQRKQQQKKSQWSILIAGGTTNTTDKNFLFRPDNTIVYKPAGSNVSDTLRKMKQGYTGFHATVGIEYSDRLSPKWTLYAGIQYTFLLNHQRTGKKVVEESEISQSIDTSYSSSKSFIKIPYHYPDGTSAVNTNYANWLELPVGIGYTINPRSHTKVEIRTGASIVKMFDDRWLVADGRYNKFYYSNQLTNNIIVNWHADAFITLPDQKKIGLQIQHSITPFAKQSVQPSTYWSNISIYTTFPIK